jgi:hypothetical protein
MNKEELIDFMIESINEDNRQICRRNNMSEADIEAMITQSQQGLLFMISNIVGKMKERGLLA